MPAPELQQAEIPTKCLCQGSSLRPQPSWGFLPWCGSPGLPWCPPNWSVLDNQAATAQTGTACLQQLHHMVWGARDLVPKGHPLPSHSSQQKMSLKWEASKLFSVWSVSASKVPTCASRTYSTERKLPPTCQSAASLAFPLPVFQKMGFWCVQRKRFWGRKLPFFQRKCICPAFYWICHSTELSVSPALKGNGCLKINLRHLQMHSVYWRLSLLPVKGLRWQRFWGTGDLKHLLHCRSVHCSFLQDCWVNTNWPVLWRLVSFPACLQWFENFDGLWKALPRHLVLMNACKTAFRLPAAVKNQQEGEAQH